MERFVIDPLEDARLPFARNTVEAALAYMPFGSGLGTFVPVYAMFEKPEDTMADVYANHAHNDVLELWLNAGAMGLVLVGMFVVWLVLRSIEIWRSAPPEGASELDWTLARAATIVVALLVVHSLLDYPLRTGAMMAVMAFACCAPDRTSLRCPTAHATAGCGTNQNAASGHAEASSCCRYTAADRCPKENIRRAQARSCCRYTAADRCPKENIRRAQARSCCTHGRTTAEI